MEGEGGVPPEVAGPNRRTEIRSPGGDRGVLLEGTAELETSSNPPDQVNNTDSAQGSIETAEQAADYLERLKNLSPRERAQRYLHETAREIINRRLINGKYDQDVALKEKVDSALLINEESKVTLQSSESLKNMIFLLEEAKGENGRLEEAAEDALREITPYIKVKVETSEGSEMYSFSDWKNRLEQFSPEERAQLEQEGLYGFKFPEEPVASTESADETVEDLFNSQKASLQEKIRQKEAKGEDISAERTQLTLISYAENGEGDNAAYLRRIALKSIGRLGVDIDRFLTKYVKEEDEKSDMQKAEERGKQKIYIGLDRYKGELSQKQIEAILSGSFDVEGLMKTDWEKYSDLPETIMGRSLSADETKEMMNTVLGDEKTKYLTKKYGKNILFVIMGLLFMSTIGAVEVAKAGSSR